MHVAFADQNAGHLLKNYDVTVHELRVHRECCQSIALVDVEFCMQQSLMYCIITNSIQGIPF